MPLKRHRFRLGRTIRRCFYNERGSTVDFQRGTPATSAEDGERPLDGERPTPGVAADAGGGAIKEAGC
jgi:hypothetical protein